jgi:hypothetical protein
MKHYGGSAPAFAMAIVGIPCLLGSALCAQNPNDSGRSNSWTSVTEAQNSGSTNPIRTRVSHSDTGNREMETRSLERIGSDGHYEAYLVMEKETIRIDSTTVSTVERSYVRDPDGRRQLTQVTEGESRTLADGEVRKVRTTSNPDVNGRLQVVQKEIEDKKQTSPNVQDTRTSEFTSDVNGGLKESVRTERRETRSDDHTVRFQETNLMRDGNGNWQTLEVRQGVVKDDGKQRSKEENVLRPDSDGKLLVVQRTMSKEIASASGETQSTTETYSVDLPGATRDRNLHSVERVTTVRRVGQDGQRSTQTHVENPNPGSLTQGMRVTSQVDEFVTRGADGISHETRTLQTIDGSGSLGVVWVDMGISDKPVQVDVTVPTPAQSLAAQSTAKTQPAEPATQPSSRPK